MNSIIYLRKSSTSNTTKVVAAPTATSDQHHRSEHMVVTNASNANGAGGITQDHRTIVAIRKHVIAEGSLAGGDEGISIDETADGGVVKTALQVIQTGFSIVYITATQKCVIGIVLETSLLIPVFIFYHSLLTTAR